MGGEVNQKFITGANAPYEMAFDAEHIYWTNRSNNGTGTIGRASLGGLPSRVGGHAASGCKKVSPRQGPAEGGTSITITGGRFRGTMAVRFGATPATNVVVHSSTWITATSPPKAPGVVDVTVTTPNGTSRLSSSDHFTFK
jgi:hypothetical protein